MNRPKLEFTFNWTIQNYSFIPLLYGKCDSPEFTPEGFGGTSWILRLLPDALQHHIGTLYLVRTEDAGPEEFLVNIEMSVTRTDGSILYWEECERFYGNFTSHGFKVFVNMNELREQLLYLPRDTLIVCCKMWKDGEGLQNIKGCSALTRVGIERISFFHEVENFSSFEEEDKKIIQVPCRTKDEVSFSSSLCLDSVLRVHGLRYPGAIIVETWPSDHNYILCRKKFSLINTWKKSVECAKVDYRYSVHRVATQKMLRTFTKASILEKKSEYLPNDQLRLLCEYTFCTGLLSEIEKIHYAMPLQPRNAIGKHENRAVVKYAHPPVSEDSKRSGNRCPSTDNIVLPTNHFESLNQIASNDPNKAVCNVAEKLQPTDACETICNDNTRAAENVGPVALEDMKININDEHLCSDNIEQSKQLSVALNEADQIEPTCSGTEKLSASSSVTSDHSIASEDVKKVGNDKSPTDKSEPSRKLVPLNDTAGRNRNEGDIEKQPKFPTVTSDLRALYKAQLLTDIELKTATKSFPVHKLVLCIRSSVFRALLTHNMEVGNTSYLQVDDMEDETLHQFLLFLYSDDVENLKWESAVQLYRAGVKYDIETLKDLCASILVSHFCTSTATEVLVLADEHNDAELKQLIENFILAHDKEVFSSEEWIKLSQTNPQLANKTMLLKYCGEQRGK